MSKVLKHKVKSSLISLTCFTMTTGASEVVVGAGAGVVGGLVGVASVVGAGSWALLSVVSWHATKPALRSKHACKQRR